MRIHGATFVLFNCYHMCFLVAIYSVLLSRNTGRVTVSYERHWTLRWNRDKDFDDSAHDPLYYGTFSVAGCARFILKIVL